MMIFLTLMVGIPNGGADAFRAIILQEFQIETRISVGKKASRLHLLMINEQSKACGKILTTQRLYADGGGNLLLHKLGEINFCFKKCPFTSGSENRYGSFPIRIIFVSPFNSKSLPIVIKWMKNEFMSTRVILKLVTIFFIFISILQTLVEIPTKLNFNSRFVPNFNIIVGSGDLYKIFLQFQGMHGPSGFGQAQDSDMSWVIWGFFFLIRRSLCCC